MRIEFGGDKFTYLDWEVELFENGYDDSWKNDFPKLIDKLEEPEQILKHDHRSCVGMLEYQGTKYIIKQYIKQQTWFWYQWTSILFPSRGEVAVRNSFRLKNVGLTTPDPVLLMQKYKRGKVIDSRYVYRYLTGETLTCEDAKRIVDILKKFHKAGLIHRDPHPENFIQTAKGIGMIDTSTIRLSWNPYLHAYDVVILSKDCPNAPTLYGRKQMGLWYPLAVIGYKLVNFYRNVKKSIRKVLGLQQRRNF